MMWNHSRVARGCLQPVLVDGSSGVHLEEYSYRGLGTIVKRVRPEDGVDLTYIDPGDTLAGHDGGDQYTGLDRFGRVAEQLWIKSGTAKDRFQYGYDADGNVMYKNNTVSTGNSELYHVDGSSNGYDGLNRLIAFSRGTLNGSFDTTSSDTRNQSWSLDQLGNSGDTLGTAVTGVTTDGTGQTRIHNKQNEVTQVAGNNLTFDNNGNTTKDETGKQYVYDAWNRMVKAKSSGGSTLRSFTYDAEGRQATRSGFDPEIYYSDKYQDIEDRDNAYSPATIAQNVWSMAYVDAMVLRDRDADLLGNTGTYGLAGSGLEERLYVQQDANFNVTAIVGTSGTVVERYKYDPYGSVSFMDGSFGARGSSSYSWVNLFQGGYYETQDGLYYFRNRYLSPTLQRWMQADPMGYVDGLSQYLYVKSNPVRYVDPAGLAYRPPPPKPPIAGRGTLSATLGYATDSDSAFSASFKPSAEVITKCLCEEISFRQFTKSDRKSHVIGIVPMHTVWPWEIDTADPYPFQTPWLSSVPNNPSATMGDQPGANDTTTYDWFSQDFDTQAICRKGKEKGMKYGEVLWGHVFDFTAGTVKRYIGFGGKFMTRTGKNTDPKIQVTYRG
jgi:RHS repeat-associated protein